MPLFLVERELAEELESSDDDFRRLLEYNAQHDLRWLFSFLSADKRKSYCLYEAPDPEALRAQAEALGIPADEIIEVSELSEAVAMGGTSVTGYPAA